MGAEVTHDDSATLHTPSTFLTFTTYSSIHVPMVQTAATYKWMFLHEVPCKYSAIHEY